MKRLLLSSFLLLTAVGSGSGSFGADFQKGMEAYERGDHAAALKEIRPLADQGHVDAQYQLSEWYKVGYAWPDLPQDYEIAIKWATLAAKQGHAGAQYSLGVSYFMALGVPQDYAEGVKWFRLRG